jgi:hypothetical protein
MGKVCLGIPGKLGCERIKSKLRNHGYWKGCHIYPPPSSSPTGLPVLKPTDSGLPPTTCSRLWAEVTTFNKSLKQAALHKVRLAKDTETHSPLSVCEAQFKF